MKQYTISCQSYSVDELSDKAKQRAYYSWRNSAEYFDSGEIENTLKKFCEYFDVKCTHWEYDEYNHHYRFEISNDIFEENENIKGIRLAKYIWNNYAKYITKGKYFSLWSKIEKSERNPSMGKLKDRHSKVMLEMDNCPLTGYCFDCDVLDPIIDCLTYKKSYDSYEDLIDECLDKLFYAAEKDYAYSLSVECFLEDAKSNDWEYDENGNMFKLPLGSKIA